MTEVLFAFFAVLGVFAKRILRAKTPRTAKNAKKIGADNESFD